MRSSPLRAAWMALSIASSGCGAAADPPERPGDRDAENGGEVRPDAFQITIGRQLRVGERFRFERRQKIDSIKTETRDGEKLGEERLLTMTTFAGAGAVTSADEKGNERSFEYVVEAFARSDETGEWSLPRGTQIRVVRGIDDASAVIEIDGRAATAAERAAIAIFVGLTHKDVGDDAIFGTRQARRVGEGWSAREDLIRSQLEAEGVVVPADGLRATAKLLGATRTPDGHLREILTDLTVDGFVVPDLPAGVTTRDAKLHVSATLVVAPDGRVLENRSKRRSDFEFAVENPSAGPSRLTVAEETTYESLTRPLAP